MVNKVILVGNLGQDPEVRTTQGGTSVCNMSVATSERRKDKSGEYSDHTEWHRVVVFGKQAENVGRYLNKGSKVYIEGKLSTSKWQDKEGHDRYTTEIIADGYGGVKFLSPKGEQGGGQSNGAGYGGQSNGPDLSMPF